MRSNWTPWDLIKSRPQIISPDQEGIVAINSFDPYVEKLLLNRIPHKKKLIPILGSEITPEWIENHLQTMDLFGGGESYMIMCGEELPAATKEILLNNQISAEGRLLLFLFSKSGTFFEKWSKSGVGEFIKVEAPKFWDNRKLLDFLAREMQVSLPYDVSNLLLETLNTDDSAELYHMLGMLKIYSQLDLPPTYEGTKELLDSEKLDHFKFASNYCQKRPSQFWQPLASGQFTFDQLRSLFFFMSGHLFKVFDPSYVQAKNKLSKYDQEILAYSKKWDRKELLKAIRQFSQFEVRCKAKDDALFEEIRLTYLASLK